MGSSSSKGGYVGVYSDSQGMDTSQKGNVYIYSTSFGLGILEHHSIVVDAIQGYWHIYEWSDGDGIGWRNARMYRSSKLRGTKVKYLGTHTLSEVYSAASASSSGYSYSFAGYNCNHWVENVANRLGYKVSVGGLCK